MGTNYYLRREEGEPCPHCGRSDKHDDLHIGKSSSGWCFSLNTHPDEGINSLDDWRKQFAAPGARIIDEYGRHVTTDEMLSTITERVWRGGPPEHHPLDRVCIAHGDGTYDLMRGEFC